MTLVYSAQPMAGSGQEDGFRRPYGYRLGLPTFVGPGGNAEEAP
jgi:hypothetical protein